MSLDLVCVCFVFKLIRLEEKQMSEWDFLWGLKGQELEDAMSSGGTAGDWDFVEEQQRKKRRVEWDKLKASRDSGEISPDEFKKRKSILFPNESK